MYISPGGTTGGAVAGGGALAATGAPNIAVAVGVACVVGLTGLFMYRSASVIRRNGR
jgi:hypothetical protein